jgi:hypothetical protein
MWCASSLLDDLRGEMSVSIWVRLRRAGSGVVFDSAEKPSFFISDRREECFGFKYEGCERQIFVNFGPNSQK